MCIYVSFLLGSEIPGNEIECSDFQRGLRAGEVTLLFRVLACHAQRSWVHFPELHKPCMVARRWGVEAGRLEVYPWLQSKFEASLRYQHIKSAPWSVVLTPMG